MTFSEDMHVHSTFSDGKDTVEKNIESALGVGLLHLGCVDHVRRDTHWVPQYVEHVTSLSRCTPLKLTCGVEAKLLSPQGLLDLPKETELRGVDFILAADHCLPLGKRLLSPEKAKFEIREGNLSAMLVVEALVKSYVGMMENYCHRNIIVAHPFSFLRRAGIKESVLTSSQLSRFADAARLYRVQVEISERWRCPSAPTICALRKAGVRLRLSTDSHRAKHVGRYSWAREEIALSWGYE